MRKILSLLFAVMIVQAAQSQTIINGRYYNNINAWYKYRGVKLDSNFTLPTIIPIYGIESGSLYANTTDSSLYLLIGATWVKQRGTGSGGTGSNFANTNLTLDGNRAHNGLGLYSIQLANPTLFKVYTVGDSSVLLIQTAGNTMLSWDKYNIIKSYSQRSGKNSVVHTDTNVVRISRDAPGGVSTEITLTDNEIIQAIGTDTLIRLKGDSVKFKMVNNTAKDSVLRLTASGKLEQVHKNTLGGVTDGDKGDISVAGDVWTINNGEVVNTMLADMPAHTFKGNNTGTSDVTLNLTIAEMQAELGLPAVSFKLSSVSTNTTVSTSANIYLVSTPSADVTMSVNPVTFYSSGIVTILRFKKVTNNAYTVIITPSSGTINGSSSYTLTLYNESVTVISDGTNLYTF